MCAPRAMRKNCEIAVPPVTLDAERRATEGVFRNTIHLALRALSDGRFGDRRSRQWRSMTEARLTAERAFLCAPSAYAQGASKCGAAFGAHWSL